MRAAIVQARMGSSRLPGKVLAPLEGGRGGTVKPVLERVVERLQRVKGLDTVIVATSDSVADEAVAVHCARLGVSCFRGSESDVLDRFHGAAREAGAEVLVRITADCPLLDPEVVERVLREFLEGADVDYASNINPPTYPDGLDCEVFSFEALQRAWSEARLRSEREHVTLYIRQHPELFRMRNVRHDRDLSAMRWVVDEQADLDFVRSVFAHFGDAAFGLDDVLGFLDTRPELSGINAAFTRDEGLKKSLLEDGFTT